MLQREIYRKADCSEIAGHILRAARGNCNSRPTAVRFIVFANEGCMVSPGAKNRCAATWQSLGNKHRWRHGWRHHGRAP